MYSNADSCKNILIGTSLSDKLTIPGFCNLAFSGLSFMNGLKLLCQSEHIPQNAFIEINGLLRQEDVAFTEQILNPFLYNLKKWVPTLQDGKQPIGIATVKLAEFIRGFKKKKARDSLAVKPVDNLIFTRLLNDRIKEYAKTPPHDELVKDIDKLKSVITLLESKGVKISFYEMPINEALSKSPQSVAIRNAFFSAFPKRTYHYVPQPDCSNYQTNDGIHLTNDALLAYRQYFIDHHSRVIQ